MTKLIFPYLVYGFFNGILLWLGYYGFAIKLLRQKKRTIDNKLTYYKKITINSIFQSEQELQHVFVGIEEICNNGIDFAEFVWKLDLTISLVNASVFLFIISFRLYGNNNYVAFWIFFSIAVISACMFIFMQQKIKKTAEYERALNIDCNTWTQAPCGIDINTTPEIKEKTKEYNEINQYIVYLLREELLKNKYGKNLKREMKKTTWLFCAIGLFLNIVCGLIVI